MDIINKERLAKSSEWEDLKSYLLEELEEIKDVANMNGMNDYKMDFQSMCTGKILAVRLIRNIINDIDRFKETTPLSGPDNWE